MEKEFPIKGRYVVLLWLAPIFYSPGLGTIYSFIGENAGDYWYDIAFYYYYSFIFLTLLTALVLFHRISWRNMFLSTNLQEYKDGLKLTACLFLFSVFSTYVVFLPLSYSYPDFVNYWLIELPPVIYWSKGSFPFWPNLLSFLSLTILAPVTEEIAFRGLLLHRWTQKWNVNRAILLSSIMFGLLHTDPIGAFAFGVAMCILYLRTQTLLVPIVCHAANNFVAWLIEAGYIAYLGPEFTYTLEGFQSDWWIGLVSGSIAITWTYIYFRAPRTNRSWALPDIERN